MINQSKPAFEIIIVNDASSDSETISILGDIPHPNVKVYHHDRNLGLSEARNTGFKNAKGSHVLFLDADDYFDINAIEEMVKAFPIRGDRFFVYCDLTFRGDREGISEQIYYPFSQLMRNRIPYSIMIPKSSISWGNPYSPNLKLGLEDWDLNLTLLEREFEPIRVDKPLFNYYVDVNGMFTRLTQYHYFSIWKEIISRHSGLYSKSNLLKLFRLERQEHLRSFPFVALVLLMLSFLPFAQTLDSIFVTFRKYKLFQKRASIYLRRFQ